MNWSSIQVRLLYKIQARILCFELVKINKNKSLLSGLIWKLYVIEFLFVSKTELLIVSICYAYKLNNNNVVFLSWSWLNTKKIVFFLITEVHGTKEFLYFLLFKYLHSHVVIHCKKIVILQMITLLSYLLSFIYEKIGNVVLSDLK